MSINTQIYGSYGHPSVHGSARARSAYAEEVPETGTGGYLLGERLYDPTFRRFHKADPLSPFDEGGVNRYVLGTVLTRPAAEPVTSGEKTNIARYLNIGNSGTLGQLMSRENIAGITTSDMKKKIRRPGEHVHAYCYSGVDPLMTRKLKIAPLPIYRLP